MCLGCREGGRGERERGGGPIFKWKHTRRYIDRVVVGCTEEEEEGDSGRRRHHLYRLRLRRRRFSLARKLMMRSNSALVEYRLNWEEHSSTPTEPSCAFSFSCVCGGGGGGWWGPSRLIIWCHHRAENRLFLFSSLLLVVFLGKLGLMAQQCERRRGGKGGGGGGVSEGKETIGVAWCSPLVKDDDNDDVGLH